MGSLLSLFQLTAKVDNRLMVEVVNTTSISAHVWINGGGPLVAALPPGERTTIAVPSHIKAGLKRAKWQATASTYNSISIARGTVSFDPSGGPPSITITTCGVPLRTLIYLVGVQRVWRARTAAAVAQRKRLVAQRKRSAAVNLQRAARGFLARCRVQCFICLDEMPPAAMVRTSRSCRDHRHRVCGPCAAMYVDHEVGEARFYIPCPGAGCKHLVNTEDLGKLGRDPSSAQAFMTSYRDRLTAQHASRLASIMADPDLLAFAKEQCRVCPACGVLIYRYDGCNSMRCRCGTTFSWTSELAQLAVVDEMQRDGSVEP